MNSPKNLKHYICNVLTLSLFFIFFSQSQNSNSQQLAFPTAEGAGAYSLGGRNGTVSVVTNLNDNGPGSLRSFANVSNTTIVFNVSGVINLSSPLFLYGNNVTIAGQTSPKGGITIEGSTVIFQNNQNFICRYIRFRGGYHQGDTHDSVAGFGLIDVIFDHCSISFGGDEAISLLVDTVNDFGGGLTVQNCLIAESKTGSIMGGEGAPDNFGDFSMIRNVYYNITHRVPNIVGNTRFDIINNYIHNCKWRLLNTSTGPQLNQLNNLYDYGNLPEIQVYDQRMNMHTCFEGASLPTIYTNGNVILGVQGNGSIHQPVTSTIEQVNANNTLSWKYFYTGSSCGTGYKTVGDQLEPQFFTNTQFPILGVAPTILNASDLKSQIVLDSGASKRLNADGSVSDNSDVLDAEWKTNIMQGNYIPKMAQTDYSTPAIASIIRPDNYDTDNDGMPNTWEIANGLNPNNASDRNIVQPDGYTNLEYFLNGMNLQVSGITVIASPDISICSGSSTTLTATGGSTYLWSNGATTSDITVSPNSTTIYTVTAFDASGINSDTADVTVTVNSIPTINAGNDLTIYVGESATLTASGGTSYVWSNGAITQSITVNPATTTTYTVTGTTNGCENTDSVTVFLVDDGVAVNAGNDTEICQGESTALTASGGETYVWSTGATTASITVNPNTTTTYTVTAYNASGNNSDTDEVIVSVTTPPTANAGDDVATCLGTSVTLTASGGSSYLWNTGANTASITVNPTDTTTYSVEVTQNGCSDTDDVTVTVSPLPTINAGNDVTINLGESVSLTATGGTSYVWNTGATTATMAVSPTATTTYSVTGKSNGCEATDSVTVTVIEDSVIANAGANRTICFGFSVVLTASGGDTYVWSTGETTPSITVTPNSTTTYSVTAFSGTLQDTDEVTVFVNPNPEVNILNGSNVTILEGEFVTLSATGAKTYLWNNGATQPNIAVSPGITTTFSVTGYVNNCEDVKEVMVNVVPQVIAFAGDDQTICLSESITLSASGGDEFLWNTGETTPSITVSPIEDSVYSVTVYNELDYDIADVKVFVNDCSETEIPEDTERFEFLVYPNPTSGNLHIKITGLLNVSSIYLYDLSGKVLIKETITNESQLGFERILDLSGYSNGLYLLKLLDNGKSITKKIIVNKKQFSSSK